MSRGKVNSDSIQIDVDWNNQNSDNQPYRRGDTNNNNNEVGIFSFRNLKNNSVQTNNEMDDQDYGLISKQNQQFNQNQLGSANFNSNSFKSQNNGNQNQNQSIHQNSLSQQSIQINPSGSLQTFGNVSNQRKDRDSSNSPHDSFYQQPMHQRFNSDSIINNAIGGGFNMTNSEFVGNSTNGNNSHNNGQYKQQNGNNQQQNNNYNNSNHQQQNQNRAGPQNQQQVNGYGKQNNYYVDGSYSNGRGSSINNFIYNSNLQNNNQFNSNSTLNSNFNTNEQNFKLNQMNTQSQNASRSNSIHQNSTQNNMTSQNSKLNNQFYNNSNQVQGNSVNNQNQNQINQLKNQINYQNSQHNSSLQGQFNNEQQTYNQTNLINQNQSQVDSQQYGFNSQNKNIHQSSLSNQFNSPKVNNQNNNSVQSNSNLQLNPYSQKYLANPEKQYISIDKSYLSSINSNRNNQSNNQSIQFTSPRSDSNFLHNGSTQSQGNQQNPQLKIGGLRQNSLSSIQKASNNPPSSKEQISVIDTKDIQIKDSSRSNTQKSPEDEFLMKFKKLKNNDFINRPQSNNPEKRRQKSYYYPHAELNLTDNNPNQIEQSGHKHSLSNNSFNNGNGITNSNNNSFLARKASKVSDFINYPTHSKRKVDLINTSGKKDTSRYESSLVLTKENNIDSQLHQIGSPFSPQGILDNFSCKNSIRQQDGNAKNLFKQEDSIIQNNNANVVGQQGNKSKAIQNNYFSSEDSLQQIPFNSGRTNIENTTSIYNKNSQDIGYPKNIKIDQSNFGILVPSQQLQKQEIISNSLISPTQKNIQNKENYQKTGINYPSHKDYLGRSQSVGLVQKKQKIFKEQSQKNTPLIKNTNGLTTPKNVLQISHETFQIDKQTQEAKKQFFEQNLSVLMKNNNNNHNQSINEKDVKRQKSSTLDNKISQKDEENLKKYIQNQQNTNIKSVSKSRQQDVIKTNINSAKATRSNSKEIFSNNKSKPANNPIRHNQNNDYQFTKNQEKSLKKTAAEYLMQKASKQQTAGQNISGHTPQNISQKNTLKDQFNTSSNYQTMKFTIATTLPSNYENQNKFTKYSDNFIKKKSLPTYQNTNEDIPFQNYLKKNNIQLNNINLNNQNNDSNKQNDINLNNREKQKTPRQKIFDHDSSQNRSFNKGDKSRDISPKMTPNHSFMNKSPYLKETDNETDGIVTANNSIDYRNSPLVSKNPKTQYYQKQQQQYIDFKENIESCDVIDQNLPHQNKPKSPLESKHDKTQSYFTKVKSENKPDGVQQQQNHFNKDRQFNEQTQFQALEKQIYPLGVTDQYKLMYNKDQQNLNQVMNTFNQKKIVVGQLANISEQDAYLDSKYGKSANNSNQININNNVTPRNTQNDYDYSSSNQFGQQVNQNSVNVQKLLLSNRNNYSEKQPLFYHCKICQIFTKDNSQQHDIICKKQPIKVELMQKNDQISFINQRLRNLQEFQQIIFSMITTNKVLFYCEFHEESLKEILSNNNMVEKMQNTYQDIKLLFERAQSYIQQQQNNTQIPPDQQQYNKDLLQLIEATVLLAFQKLRAINL